VKALVDDAPRAASAPALWPSIREYPIHDAGLYQALASDEKRNDRFRAALKELAGGRVVLDIGTGEQLIWAREGIAAGARHAVAMEVMDDTLETASRNLAEWGLQDAVTLLHGASTELGVTTRADVCVAEATLRSADEGPTAWFFSPHHGTVLHSHPLYRRLFVMG
jgi:protein arginine N-methyltransferase 1